MKQFFLLFIFSLLVAVGAIIHGIYMDLNLTEIRRLTSEGIMLTTLVVFPGLLVTEWLFDMDNKKKMKELEERIKELETKK